MYLKLPPKLNNIGSDSRHNQNLTPELSSSLLSNYCSSCSRKSGCEIKSELERTVMDEKIFQHHSLIVLEDEEIFDATVMDFYTEDEITEREDGYYETSDGMIFTPVTHDDIPVFSVCLIYQSQQRFLPGLESEYSDFIQPLLNQFHKI